MEEFLLRNAKDTDVDLTYIWAANPKIRTFSFNQNEIVFEEHKQWFFKKIKSKDCYYFLLDKNIETIGSIRFDIKENEAIISYLIDSKYFGSGYGVVLLQKGIQRLINLNDKRISKIVGYVMKNNFPSIKAFEKLNFEKDEIDQNNIKFYKEILE